MSDPNSDPNEATSNPTSPEKNSSKAEGTPGGKETPVPLVDPTDSRVRQSVMDTLTIEDFKAKFPNYGVSSATHNQTPEKKPRPAWMNHANAVVIAGSIAALSVLFFGFNPVLFGITLASAFALSFLVQFPDGLTRVFSPTNKLGFGVMLLFGLAIAGFAAYVGITAGAGAIPFLGTLLGVAAPAIASFETVTALIVISAAAGVAYGIVGRLFQAVASGFVGLLTPRQSSGAAKKDRLWGPLQFASDSHSDNEDLGDDHSEVHSIDPGNLVELQPMFTLQQESSSSQVGDSTTPVVQNSHVVTPNSS